MHSYNLAWLLNENFPGKEKLAAKNLTYLKYGNKFLTTGINSTIMLGNNIIVSQSK